MQSQVKKPYKRKSFSPWETYSATIQIHYSVLCVEKMGGFSPLFVLAVVLIGIPFGINGAKLAYDYYKYSCPNLETIVKREMPSIFLTDATAPAAFLRLMFHDCQVQVRLHLHLLFLFFLLSLGFFFFFKAFQIIQIMSLNLLIFVLSMIKVNYKK